MPHCTTVLSEPVHLIDLSFLSENQDISDDELFEGDMKFLPGQTRGSVSGNLWPNGVFVYDIEESLSESLLP